MVTRFVRLAVVVVIACALTLSASPVSFAHHAGAKPSAGGVTLGVWDFFETTKTGPGRSAFEKVANAWAQKTGNKVNFLGLNPGQAKECVAGPAGQGADVIGMPHDQLSDLLNCKMVAPVPSSVFSKSMQTQYIKPAVEGVTVGGKVYGMPYSIETTGIYYNKALISPSFFKPYPKGVPLAKLAAKAKSLTKNGTYGFVYPLNNFYFVYAFISGAGGYVFKYVRGKGYDWHNMGLDSAAAIRGWTVLKDLTDAGKYKLDPASMTQDTATSLFGSGKAAMIIDGPWDIANYKAKGINLGFAPDPAIDSKHPAHPFSGVQIFSVNRYSKHQKEAFDFLKYVTQNMQMPEFKAAGHLPVLKKYLNSKTVQKDPLAAPLSKAALNGQPMPNIPEMQQVWTPTASALALIAKGSVSPADAAHQTVTAIKQAIAKAHGG